MNELQLAEILGSLAVRLEDEGDAESTLQAIVSSAIDLVPGATWAGVSLIEGRQVTARAPTDPMVAWLDELQSELDQGPCIDALRLHRTVRINDMLTETRWPMYCRAASEQGARSLMSFQLFVMSRNLGALNLYGDAPNAFDDESEAIGLLLAQHASVAMSADLTETQLKSALETRDIIGQAKGLLMERNNVSGLTAFRMMIRASQDTNTKLSKLAEMLVDVHENAVRENPQTRT